MASPKFERIPVLLDTDIGSDIDDAICLSYLLVQPRCDLLGVTTVSGKPRLRAALADAVCKAAGRDDVPIHAGTEDALFGPTPQPEVPQAAILDRFDHRPAEDFAPNDAVAFLRETILSRPDPVTLLSIGPMTNVGLLLATYPEVAARLGALVLMGGVFSDRVPTRRPQEWNVWCDPAAARIVYRSPVAGHRSLGLDVTLRCVMPSDEAIGRFEAAGGPLSVAAAATEVWAAHAPNVTFHDPLAGVAVFRPDVCTWDRGRVSVELTSRRFRGATSFDPDPEGPHDVATDVDVPRFFDELFTARYR